MKISVPADPKPPAKGTVFLNTNDNKIYAWTGKRWINLEDDNV